jgi:stress response protein YsnF
MSDEAPANPDVVIPVVQEEVHADAQPVVTGGVRVTKHVDTHNEIIEQQLRTSRADVKRVKTNRVVDGPQAPKRVGNTLIIPVVSEQIHIEKRWVVTEEIHVIQHDEVETVQQTIPVNYERAELERLDARGNATPVEDVPVVEQATPVPEMMDTAHPESVEEERRTRSLLKRTDAAAAKPASRTRSLLRDRKSS